MQTTKGYLLFFAISTSRSQERAFEFDFRREFYYMSGPGEGRGIMAWDLVPLSILSTGKDIQT